MIVATLAWIAVGTQKPEELNVTIPGSAVSFTMSRLPAGEVTVAGKATQVKSIWVAQTEVTWDLYDVYAFRMDMSREDQAKGVDAQARPSKPYGAPDRGFGHAGYPALGMTSNAASKFCEWLSRKTGKSFRLPTEAEWECAARAGATSEPSPLIDFAWHWENAEDSTQPVGKRKPNAWGLYDMLGNAREWAIDPKGTAVACGGSYEDKAAVVKFSLRHYYDPKWQEADAHVPKSKWWLSDGPFIGMRVVCEP